jgi:hypothetical protein
MWRNLDSNVKIRPLVAWKKSTNPKRKGGLGIINLRSQNNALLLRHLDKFYKKVDIPWVNLIWNTHYANGEVPHATKDKGSFWWRDILKLADIYMGIASCKVGDGTTVVFWSDVWNGHLGINYHRQRRWLELIKDYDLEINYHHGEDNVVAEALSQRSHVSQLVVDSMPFELCEKFDKLNLRIITNTGAMEMEVGSSLF